MPTGGDAHGTEKNDQQPPPGYPTGAPPEKMPRGAKFTKKGERGLIEGCLAGLCCCWLCEECC